MTQHEDGLTRECRVFARYLLGTAPTPYVIDKYVDAHRVSAAYSSERRFDDVLVRLARQHGVLTKLVDSYAGVLAPTALVRRKLILLLAILETCAPSSRIVESVDGGSRVTLLARLVVRGVGSLLSLLAGAVLLLPLQLVLGAGARSAR